MGLLALMLIHEARRRTRTDAEGEVILLEDQDRRLWNRALIKEGDALIRRSLLTRNFGHFTLEAAIASVHAEAAEAADTDWAEIVGLYDLLYRADPSPVVELNRAVALAMRDGPEAGLAIIDAIFARGELREYQPAHASRAELLRRLGRFSMAIEAFNKARELSGQGPTTRFIDRRLRELGASSEGRGS